MSTMAVTVSITVMCQFAVRHACVCCARPIGPVLGTRAIPFHQSQKPVSAVRRDTRNPATITSVAATKKSCAARPWSLCAATYDTRSNPAAST